MKKLSILELEDRLYWLNESMESFKNGYAEYLMKKYKKAGDHNVPICGVTAICFGHPNGPEDSYDANEDKYSKDYFNFVRDNHFESYKKFMVDDPILSLKDYKKVMYNLTTRYIDKLFNSVKKSDKKIIDEKIEIYQDFYKWLNF
jgi:hypothetical protein